MRQAEFERIGAGSGSQFVHKGFSSKIVGGGRKRAVDLDPALRTALLALVEPEERGDPMSPLRWTTKSTRHLADQLTRQGHRISAASGGDGVRCRRGLQ